jgi:serine/threonine-protein kinase
MSPEQSHGLSSTPESDTFSLGLILFEMLTATRALSEKNLVTLLLHLQDASLADELSAKVPSAFQDLLSLMLANNPENRPAMKDVAEQLQQINKSQSVSSA